MLWADPAAMHAENSAQGLKLHGLQSKISSLEMLAVEPELSLRWFAIISGSIILTSDVAEQECEVC